MATRIIILISCVLCLCGFSLLVADDPQESSRPTCSDDDCTSSVNPDEHKDPSQTLDYRTGDDPSSPAVTILQATGKGWDKKHCCVFCQRYYSKIARHFEQKHAKESAVARVLLLPKKSKERKKMWLELRNKGNFSHNTKVLRKGCGKLIPSKRPRTVDAAPHDFVPCAHCLGLFQKKVLWRHVKQCSCHPVGKCTRNHVQQGSSLLPVAKCVSQVFKDEILNTMGVDEISFVAKKDDLICRYGEKLFAKHRKYAHRNQYVKQKIRELGRFLVAARKKSQGLRNLRLSECLSPKMFDTVCDTVKDVSKYNPATGQFEIPSLAMKLGHALSKCANILKSVSIKEENTDLRKQTEAFLELYMSEWTSEISAHALQQLNQRKFNNPKRLPLARDLQKVNTYLQTRAHEILKHIQTDLPLAELILDWHQLSKVTLTQIVLFNRRRSGEAERIKVEHYHASMKNGKQIQDDLLSGLSELEKHLTQVLHRVDIPGKCGRRVPVLLSQQLKKQVECLLKYRGKVGVDADNPYLFARGSGAKTPISSCAALRQFTEESGTEMPDLITSTALRKHVATTSQILNLKNHELDALANFMGHDVRIHRDFYRLPEDTMQLAKVSKLLIELEAGNISKYRGKSLDEIHIDQDETVETEGVDILPEIPVGTEGVDILPEIPMGTEGVDIFSEIPSDNEHEDREMAESHEVLHKSRRRSRNSKPSPPARHKWTESEKQAVQRQLGHCFRAETLPGKIECEKAKQREPSLINRAWQQIKFFVKNNITTKRRRLQRDMFDF